MKKKLPPWFRVKLPTGQAASQMHQRLRRLRLHTVCEEARCPNQGECFGCGTATFLLLGSVCTRACRFCAVTKGNPGGYVDEDEPRRVAEGVRDARLAYVVLTSVCRDDLPDGGAGHFARTITAIREVAPRAKIEALIPDYLDEALRTVVQAGPHVVAHNIEVVRRLTPVLRSRKASYERSLEVLRQAKALSDRLITKSSLILGAGETREEVVEALRDLREAGVSVVTMGQYLRPTAQHYPVQRFLTPQEFAELEQEALTMGFKYVASGPLVRSSYKAAELALVGLIGEE